ncbi:Eco57I restriction-modification methylase domain-containing protein [Halorussus caseinilyticus]|nr:Eco57I restriction-modification methylase domain-containing protein [Halorussus sp. DT72]
MSRDRILASDITQWSSLDDIKNTFVDKRELTDVSEEVESHVPVLKVTERNYFKLLEADPGEELYDYRQETSRRDFTVLVASHDYEKFMFITRDAMSGAGGVRHRRKTIYKDQFDDDLGDKRTILNKLNDIQSGGIAPFFEIYETRKVVNEFYREYRNHLDNLADSVPNSLDIPEAEQREFAQAVMDRIIFTYFLQEKGALSHPSDTDEYFESRILSFKRSESDLYQDFLEPLFFDLLAVPTGEREIDEERFGEVPYLNGSLFTPTEIEEEHNTIRIGEDTTAGNDLIEDYINFLGDWNWHLDETSDADDSAAITPDILGFIFEKSVNKDGLGAVYTPEEVTRYISNKSLNDRVLAGLNAQIDGEGYNSIDNLFGLVDDGEEQVFTSAGLSIQLGDLAAINLDHIEVLYFDVLPNLTILDPAVGSGAFLLAAQEALLDIYITCLAVFDNYPRQEELSSRARDEIQTSSGTSTRLRLKRSIIINNLYGVDIDPGAVEVCKLRLYLSMISDLNQGTSEIEALPNIDFNIRQGNSLFGISDAELLTSDDNDETTQQSIFSYKLKDKIDSYANKIEEFRNNEGTAADARSKIQEQHDKVQPTINSIYAGTIDQRIREEISSVDDVNQYLSDDSIDSVKLIIGFDGSPPEEAKETISDLGGRFYGAKTAHIEIETKQLRAGPHNTAIQLAEDHGFRYMKIERPMTAADLSSQYDLFHWAFEFPNVFGFGESNSGSSGFDLILENPPYISSRQLSTAESELHAELYSTVEGTGCDIFVPFIERSYDLLSDLGEFGVITSRQFMAADYGVGLRDTIADNYPLREAIDFTNYSPFEEVDAYTVILRMSTMDTDSVMCGSVRSARGVEEVRRGIRTSRPETIEGVHSFSLDPDSLSRDRWLILSEDELSAREQMESRSASTLVSDDHPGVDVRSPYKTGRDKILKGEIVSESETEYIIETKTYTTTVEQAAWRRLVRNENVDTWTIEEPTTVVFFPYKRVNDEYVLLNESELEERFPQTYEILSQYKQRLLERKDSRETFEEKGYPWYSMARVGEPTDFENTKIVTGSMIAHRQFAIDTDEYIVATGSGNARAITLGDLDQYYTLGFLNAEPVFKYMKPLCPPKQNGYFEISIEVASDLPYIDFDLNSDLYTAVCMIVDQLDVSEIKTIVTDEGVSSLLTADKKSTATHLIRAVGEVLSANYDQYSASDRADLEVIVNHCVGELFNLSEDDLTALERI